MASTVKWIVGFYQMPERAWYHRLLRLQHGFTHAFAMRYDEPHNLWHYFDWTLDGFRLHLLTSEEISRVIAHMRTFDCSFLECDVRNRHKSLYWMPTYCVTALRSLLGVRGAVFTPYQLYCALRRRGAKPYFEPNHATES